MNDYKGTLTYASNTVGSGSFTTTDSGCTATTTNTDPKYWTYTPAREGIITGIDNQEPVVISTPFVYPTPLYQNKKGGDEDMRYLYEVFLVNPKNDTCFADKIIARSEISALMKTYHNSEYDGKVDFDDLKTSCRVLMEWKKKESLKKAIETIKKAVE